MSKAIILVSATTSEGLVTHLSETYAISRQKIVTLFQLSERPPQGKLVCNLEADGKLNPDGFEPFPSFESHSCQLCDADSTVIRIAGDQFLAGETTTDEVILREVHSHHFQEIFQSTAGKNFVRANYSEPDTPATNEVFFDLDRLFGDERMLSIDQFAAQFRWIIDQEVPASAMRIISLDDPASQKMAKLVRSQLGRNNADLPILTLKQVKQDIDSHVQTTGATVVVASAVASGRNILSISQILRKIQPNELITFILGLARMPTKKELDRVRSNVSHGTNKRRYGFHIIDRTELPLYGPNRKTSWAQEEVLWRELVRTCEDSSTRSRIQSRLEELRLAPLQCGMENNLVLPTIDGRPLSLRPGFAFYQFLQPRDVSQADVFFAIVSVLHRLRQSEKNDGSSLRQHEHIRRVLSPRNFERFNDGVIQAAMLRAALPAELDYCASERLSDEMEQILDFLLEQKWAEPGEAVLEFLVAIATRRLRLNEPAIRRLLDKHANSATDGVEKQLWHFIEANPSVP